MTRTTSHWLLTLAFVVLLGCPFAPARAQPPAATSIPRADLVQPAALAALMKSAAPQPLILHVGFQTLYEQAHIPGSEYVGAASEEAGIQQLHERTAKLDRDAAIVIYCGCCPWTHCPNVAAAYRALHAQGFVHVKVLYVAANFGENWVDQGYPVTSGH